MDKRTLRLYHGTHEIIFLFLPTGEITPEGSISPVIYKEIDMSKSCFYSAYSLSSTEIKLVKRALRCLEKRLSYRSQTLNHSDYVRSYLRLHLADEKNEVFAVLFLDNHHRLLAFEKLFYGTINESAVYPRVIVQKALEHNAAKVILAHTHPSGNCDPSKTDIELTRELQRILSVISVAVIDHIIVARENSYSFADHALM